MGHARPLVHAVGHRRRGAGRRSPSSIIPQNPGYPTYWHARGYGLFAANPLGQKALSNGKDVLNFALDAGQSVTFRHRVEVTSGTPTAEVIESEWKAWAQP